MTILSFELLKPQLLHRNRLWNKHTLLAFLAKYSSNLLKLTFRLSYKVDSRITCVQIPTSCTCMKPAMHPCHLGIHS